MTPDQIKLVQQSFARVVPISEVAAVLFYDRLFESTSTIRSLALLCCGRCSKDLASTGRLKSRTPGPRLTACCRVS